MYLYTWAFFLSKADHAVLKFFLYFEKARAFQRTFFPDVHLPGIVYHSGLNIQCMLMGTSLSQDFSGFRN